MLKECLFSGWSLISRGLIVSFNVVCFSFEIFIMPFLDLMYQICQCYLLWVGILYVCWLWYFPIISPLFDFSSASETMGWNQAKISHYINPLCYFQYILQKIANTKLKVLFEMFYKLSFAKLIILELFSLNILLGHLQLNVEILVICLNVLT